MWGFFFVLVFLNKNLLVRTKVNQISIIGYYSNPKKFKIQYHSFQPPFRIVKHKKRVKPWGSTLFAFV